MAGDDRPTIADLLRHARRASGLTQEELAERAGVSVRGISDLERGINRVPRRDTLDLLATALDLPDDVRARWERLRRKLSMHAPPASNSADGPTSHLPPRSNLPALLDDLLGREQELADLKKLLAETRLVTLTGPGGTGKTRLAIAVGTEMLDAFPDGVFLVDLSPVRDAAQVVAVIAQTIGIGESSGRALLDTLSDSLCNRHMLLIVDNLEHVVDAAPALAELLAACPRLSLLATSRMRLRLRGEHDYPVRPLELPDAATHPTPGTLSQSAATELFVRRAREVLPTFQPTVENATAIAEICRRLDGLPLAIELAAARVILLPPQALLQRIEQRLSLLADGARDLPERQRSLRATLAWSYDLLTDGEQRVFRRLAVFSGGWTIEAAEAVGGEDCAAGLRDVFTELSALIEHSLVYQRESAAGMPRFAMLETI
ncbi:MAG TPA: helix-turn-helix domain-containing protein, partial [Thermomicrobiales bacterium]|nr:helix-turn-helix domain-containing protein [Thermomicrobiales bacterium]